VWRWSRAAAAALLLALLGTAPLTGQSLDTAMVRGSPPLVKYGKWLTLAAAIGMGIKAADAHNAADDAFGQLQNYCGVSQQRCNLAPNGSYLDPVAEGYYQASVRNDNRARGWLLSGELTLIGTAGLFVWELTRPKDRPRNIPFEPMMTVTPVSTRLGVAAHF